MMIKKRLTNKLILVYFLVVILPICAVYFVFVILLFPEPFSPKVKNINMKLIWP